MGIGMVPIPSRGDCASFLSEDSSAGPSPDEGQWAQGVLQQGMRLVWMGELPCAPPQTLTPTGPWPLRVVHQAPAH